MHRERGAACRSMVQTSPATCKWVARSRHLALLHEWAYAQAFSRSVYRTRALAFYLQFYNAERRHSALAYLTPLQRLAAKSVNNVFINNT